MDTRDNKNEPIERAFSEHFSAIKSVTERRTIAGLARELGKLPGDVARAAIETSASIAGVSLRASIEFLKAVPAAAILLEAPEIKAWGEIGRRFAMSDVETGISFFSGAASNLSSIPKTARPLVFEICSRQISLSTSAALDTFDTVAGFVSGLHD